MPRNTLDHRPLGVGRPQTTVNFVSWASSTERRPLWATVIRKTTAAGSPSLRQDSPELFGWGASRKAAYSFSISVEWPRIPPLVLDGATGRGAKRSRRASQELDGNRRQFDRNHSDPWGHSCMQTVWTFIDQKTNTPLDATALPSSLSGRLHAKPSQVQLLHPSQTVSPPSLTVFFVGGGGACNGNISSV